MYWDVGEIKNARITDGKAVISAVVCLKYVSFLLESQTAKLYIYTLGEMA